MPPPAGSVVVALSTFSDIAIPGSPGTPEGATRIYYSYLDPATDTWTANGLYADETTPGWGAGSAVSCGVVTPAEATAHPRGVVCYAGTSSLGWQPYYAGDGIPNAMYPIAVDNLPAGTLWEIDVPTFYSTSCGAWTVAGGLWAVIQYYWRTGTSTQHLALLPVKATAFDGAGIPTAWHSPDVANAPSVYSSSNPSFFMSNAAFRLREGGTVIDFCCPTTWGESNIFALYHYDLAAQTWSGPEGTVNMGRQIHFGRRYSHCGTPTDGIFRWANGDIGIVYSTWEAAPEHLYYRLYAGGTWGAEVLVASNYTTDAGFEGCPSFLLDLAGDKVHAFVRVYAGSGVNPSGAYHAIDHNGPVHANLYAFPSRRSDGFGRAVMLSDGRLLAPYDLRPTGGAVTPHSIWHGVLSGGTWTFTEHTIPVPAAESASPTPGCAYLCFLPAVIPIPPSTFSIFPQYHKRRNLFGS